MVSLPISPSSCIAPCYCFCYISWSRQLLNHLCSLFSTSSTCPHQRLFHCLNFSLACLSISIGDVFSVLPLSLAHCVCCLTLWPPSQLIKVECMPCLLIRPGFPSNFVWMTLWGQPVGKRRHLVNLTLVRSGKVPQKFRESIKVPNKSS